MERCVGQRTSKRRSILCLYIVPTASNVRLSGVTGLAQGVTYVLTTILLNKRSFSAGRSRRMPVSWSKARIDQTAGPYVCS